MADVKWIKLTTNMQDDEKMKLIDAMPERDTIHYLWIRLLIQAGKTNADGEIFLSEDTPYTDKMLAVIFSRPLVSIKLALKTLSRLGMIEIAPDHVIRIVNWDKHQNIEGMERVRAQNRKRAENHREKKKQIEKTAEENEEKQNNEDVKVQEDQGVNPKATVQDNKNIVPLENSCNVTENKSNVTVTVQNKKEIKNKNKKENKKENKRDIESEIKTDDINNKDSTHDEEVKESSLLQEVEDSSISLCKDVKENSITIAENDLNSKAVELMTYYEKITGVIGGINYGALRLAIDMHGTEPVKMAINRALEVNKHDMSYINGILKNWRREGYPNQGEEIKNGVRSTGKSNTADKNEFTGFRPKKSRNLTEAERKGAEEKLI